MEEEPTRPQRIDAVPHEASPGAVRELAALLRVSGALAGSLELTNVLQIAIESAVEVLGLDMGVIYTLHGDSLYLGAATPPLPDDFPEEHRHAELRDHPVLETCLRELSPVIVEDALQRELSPRERVVVESANLRSAIFVPLAVEGRALGALIVHTRGRTRSFSADDMRLCRTVSHQISLALANAQLVATLRATSAELARAYDATLKGWSRALEMRDHDTGGHTERVAEMTVRLGRRMGMSPAELIHAHRGALLHDIGKMVVPDAILHKAGPLSAEEWAVMRRHPEFARAMLREIDYLAPALDIPYCHHERWNGSGYPRQLEGEAIPLAARVFAVVDVFDALTSDRPYRPAWSREAALAHVRDHSGTLFDSRVVAAFSTETA